jgi:large subunit ribosomal protein L9
MKIILLQDVKNLGKKNDVKEVSDGYARNFLFPKKLAEPATEAAVKKAEIKKTQEKSLKESENDALKSLAEKLKNIKIILKAKEKKGKLFGSITAKEIAKEIQKENLAVPEKCIILDEAIKKIGEYEIKIVLAPEIKTVIKLEVMGEE